MEEHKQEVKIKDFQKIFTNQGFNFQAFKQICEDQQYKVITDFIQTILRFFNLREKPGRSNPVSQLSDKEVIAFFYEINKLKSKVTSTIYELKIDQIIKICRSKTKVKIPQQTIEQIQPSQQQIQQMLENPQILNRRFKTPYILFKYVVDKVLPLISKKILAINDHNTRYSVVFESLKFLNKIFHPIEVEVQISKNTLIQTRVFKAVYENQFLKKQQWATTKLAPIINESLLCPSNMQIQELLFKILKRLYLLWGECVMGPLYLNLRNISLFSDDSLISNRILKESAIFTYKALKQKNDLKLCDMLDSSQDLKFIKQNEYYSSKACAFPNQFGEIYDTLNFELPFWEYWHWIQSRSLWVYNIIIQKTNTMLSWKFWLKNYDIRFGIYKMDKCKHLIAIQQYESQKQCKQVVKLEKYSQTSGKNPVKGHLFLKPGYYNIIFDNTYSMIRGKDLYYQIQQLETFL